MTSADTSPKGPPDALSPARMTRSEALARHLETEILDDSLAPGDRIGTKSELRQRFGVAAATVNEAVRLMEMRGLISARPGPGGGVFVAETSSRSRLAQISLGFGTTQPTLRDCVDVRNALESLICRRAAENCLQQDVKAMHKIVEAMDEVLHEPQPYLRLNWSLHRMIGDLCSNPALKNIYLMLIDVLDDGLDRFEFPDNSDEPIRIHRALVDAIADGDPAKIDAAVRQHLTVSPLPNS
jgi:DNA-binding FadR family transcriptional regulator